MTQWINVNCSTTQRATLKLNLFYVKMLFSLMFLWILSKRGINCKSAWWQPIFVRSPKSVRWPVAIHFFVYHHAWTNNWTFSASSKILYIAHVGERNIWKMHNPSLPVTRDLDGKCKHFGNLLRYFLYIYLCTNCRQTEYVVVMSKGVTTKKVQIQCRRVSGL